MKKVKIMMLSLILLGVVGGALAFKAKGPFTYCTAPAEFYDDPVSSNPDFYYCRWAANGLPVPTKAVIPANTKDCEEYRHVVIDYGIPEACITIPPAGVTTHEDCQTVKCPNLAHVILNF